MWAALPIRAARYQRSPRRTPSKPFKENSMAAVLETASSSPAGSAELPRTDAYYRLRADVEDFLYSEADLLDERRFRDWLNLLADDISYFMPIRRNVKFGQHNDRENTRTGTGISWFAEDKRTLTKRVDKI